MEIGIPRKFNLKFRVHVLKEGQQNLGRGKSCSTVMKDSESIRSDFLHAQLLYLFLVPSAKGLVAWPVCGSRNWTRLTIIRRL